MSSPVNILVVDDNPTKRAAIIAALEPLGETVVQASSGREALRLLLNEEFALILLDVRMPDMDGFETASLIRGRARSETTPIIFVTAYERAEADMLGGYALGAVDYLFSPFRPEVLRAKASVFVELHKKTEAVKAHEQRLRELELRAAQASEERLRRAHQRAARAARREVQTLSVALEQTADPVFITDRQGRIQYANPAFEAVTLWPREEVVGRTPAFLRSGEHDDALYASMWTTLLRGEVYRGEIVNRRRDGTLYVEEKTITPIKDDRGRVTGFVSTGRDVTERREVEAEIRRLNASLESRVAKRTAQLEEVNRELEAFAYSVSHDLRTPLRHMASFAQLLRRVAGSRLTERDVGYLDIIVSSAEKMNALIEDLLAFSRTGRASLTLAPVDLAALVQEVWRDLTPERAARAVDLRVGDLPVVACDRAAIRQVLYNLLSNALKYTRGRDVAQIEVGGHVDAGSVTVFVRDNGVGFDMRFAGKLFGVFQRLHRPEEFEGTGIGLAHVRRIVTKHGGRTWAEGRPGEGATFSFSLPGQARGTPATNATPEPATR